VLTQPIALEELTPMNATLKNIFLIGIGIAAGAVGTLWVTSGIVKPSPSPLSTQEQENGGRDETEQIRQSKRYWENPNDPSIRRNLERKEREFWGNPSGHR